MLFVDDDHCQEVQMRVGLHGRNDPWSGTLTEQDYRVIREAKIEMVKAFDYYQPIEDRPVPYLGETMMIDIHGDEN